MSVSPPLLVTSPLRVAVVAVTVAVVVASSIGTTTLTGASLVVNITSEP